MILLVFEKETEFTNSLVKNLDNHFFENGYQENIKYLYSDGLSAVDTVVEVTKMRPDIMIYITFEKVNPDELHHNIFVSTGKNISSETKLLQENIIDYLNIILSKTEDTYVFSNTNCSNYIIRVKPFPTLQIKIDDRLFNYGIFAKAIYKAIVSQYKIPKLNQCRYHKCAANLNMRTTPDGNGQFIVKIPKGTECIVLERTNNIYWKVKVRMNNTEYIGYCAQTYIRLA